VEAIEGEVQKILTEEKHDRLLNKADEQVSKAEKMLKEKKPLHENPPREWFQTKKERAAIKSELSSIMAVILLL
jgi:hypothetical protein